MAKKRDKMDINTETLGERMARGGGSHKIKVALYIFLFSLCIFTSSAVITFAAMTGGVGNSFNVVYEAPKDPATLITGEEFCKALKLPGNSSATYTTSDNKVKSITFDYYGSEYNDVINNASVTTDVASTSSAGDAIMYHVGDSTNGYDVYVLSSGHIIANATSSDMFYNCRGITNIIFNNFDTSNVTDMEYMFYYCEGLTTLDLSGWDSSSVTDMGHMFNSCSGLTALVVSGWDTSSVVNMAGMFCRCSVLKTIYVGSGWSTAKVTSSGSTNMFTACTSLVGGNGTIYNSSYTNKTYARVDTASTPGYLTYLGSPATLITGHGFTEALKLPGNSSATYSSSDSTVKSITFDYYSSKYNDVINNASVTTDVATADSVGDAIMYHVGDSTKGYDVYVLSSGHIIANADSGYMFYDCDGITSITFNNFDTSSVTDMDRMFYSCSGLTALDVSGFDTSSVTDMYNMFSSCSSLTTLDLSGWDTSSVTNMSWMFYGCSVLKTIYVGSGWNTASVTSSGNMFYNCKSLPNYNANYDDHTYCSRYLTYV